MLSKELLKLITSQHPPVVIDVRTGFEFKKGHIPGAIHAPGWKILFRLARLPADKNTGMVVTCEHGPRAEIAKSFLGFMGYQNVTLLEGHMSAWRKAGCPEEK